MTALFFPRDPFTPQRLPLRQMAGELLPAALILWHYHSLKKQEYRRRLPNLHELEKQLRLPQMFLAGGLAALLAGKYLHGPRPQWPHRLGYARLFSLWANHLILADAASDQQELGPEASREFLRQCLVEIFQGGLRPKVPRPSPGNWPPAGPSSKPGCTSRLRPPGCLKVPKRCRRFCILSATRTE